MWTDGWTDRHEEANSFVLQFCERAQKWILNNSVWWCRLDSHGSAKEPVLRSCEHGNEPLSSLKQHTSGLGECLLVSQDRLCSVELVTSQIPKYKWGRALLLQPAQSYKLLQVKSYPYRCTYLRKMVYRAHYPLLAPHWSYFPAKLQ
jgi:hypothetical protein